TFSVLVLIQAMSFSPVARAASTDLVERSRPTASGTTVSGKRVVFCSGRTAISNGSGRAGPAVPFGFFVVSSAIIYVVGQTVMFGRSSPIFTRPRVRARFYFALRK